MTENENRVARYKVDVLNAECNVVMAKLKLDEGYKKGQARMAQTAAEVESDYATLKADHQKAVNELTKEKADLEFALAELERGYSK